MAAGLMLAVGLAACSSSTTGPSGPPTIPDFVFVADTGLQAQLYAYHDGATTLISTGAGNDIDPQSAAGLLVFSSDRTGSGEIYLADEAGVTQHRVTNGSGPNVQPALSPTGDRIAYASMATGVTRLFVVSTPSFTDTGFPTPAALATGSDTFVPEGSPAWSPDGAQIAFVSTRTGTSQVFVVPAAGGTAQQVTHEAGGAFTPVWSADGQSVIYESVTGGEQIASVNVGTGSATTLATDSLGVGQPSCNATLCLAVTDPSGSDGAIVWFSSASPAPTVILPRTHNEREPAILVPAP